MEVYLIQYDRVIQYESYTETIGIFDEDHIDNALKKFRNSLPEKERKYVSSMVYELNELDLG